MVHACRGVLRARRQSIKTVLRNRAVGSRESCWRDPCCRRDGLQFSPSKPSICQLCPTMPCKASAQFCTINLDIRATKFQFDHHFPNAGRGNIGTLCYIGKSCACGRAQTVRSEGSLQHQISVDEETHTRNASLISFAPI